MKLPIGASRPFSAGNVTKLKQKSLFACAKSYVARSTEASLLGLECCQLYPPEDVEELTALRTFPLRLLDQ